MSQGVWVTGTDTGVGKTLVTAGLVRALSRLGRGSVAALKPVVSGAWSPVPVSGDEGVSAAGPDVSTCWEDLERLALAGGVALRPEQRSVYRFLLPASPHFAAAAEGQEVQRDTLLAGIAQARSGVDFSVIEGVGGFRVPLGLGFDTADLATWLGLPVILVVGIRLGCINHALLTGEAIADRGLRMAGWVANCGIDPSYGLVEDTIATLEEGLGLECEGRLGRLAGPVDADPSGPDANWRLAVDRQTAAAGQQLAALAQALLP